MEKEESVMKSEFQEGNKGGEETPFIEITWKKREMQPIHPPRRERGIKKKKKREKIAHFFFKERRDANGFEKTSELGRERSVPWWQNKKREMDLDSIADNRGTRSEPQREQREKKPLIDTSKKKKSSYQGKHLVVIHPGRGTEGMGKRKKREDSTSEKKKGKKKVLVNNPGGKGEA